MGYSEGQDSPYIINTYQSEYNIRFITKPIAIQLC